MYITSERRVTIAALLSFAALAISGTATGASQSSAVGSAATRSRAVLVCQGMVRNFQADVFAASTARGARESTTDLEWQGAALRAASDWLRSGCLSIAP